MITKHLKIAPFNLLIRRHIRQSCGVNGEDTYVRGRCEEGSNKAFAEEPHIGPRQVHCLVVPTVFSAFVNSVCIGNIDTFAYKAASSKRMN